MTLHRVASRLERLGGCDVLTDLSVGDATQVQQVRDLAGVCRRVDERQRFADAVERHLTITGVHLRLGQETQERRALAFLGLGRERGRHLVAHDGPVAPLGGGLRGQAMENKAFRGRERLVTEEVVEALTEPRSEDLERTNGWSDQTGLDLADKAFGELLTCQLGLAHATLASRFTYARSEAVRTARTARFHYCVGGRHIAPMPLN